METRPNLSGKLLRNAISFLFGAPFKAQIAFTLIISSLLSSCAVLTKSQIEAVGRLSVSADTALATPRVMFTNIADVRMGRGIFYAASLSTPSLHVAELNDVANFYQSDLQLADKMDLYISLLNSYLRSLKTLSLPVRYTQIGTEFRGVGRNIDSLLLRFNAFEIDDEVPIGFGKIYGRYAAYFSEKVMQHRQAALLQEYVTNCDTLVASCVDSLVSLLKREELEELFTNEEISLRENYKAFIQRLDGDNQQPNLIADREFVSLVGKLHLARKSRAKCISGLLSLKRSHHKLVTKLEERAEIEYIYEEFLEITDIIAR